MNVNSKQLNCVGNEAPKSKKPPVADLDSLSEDLPNRYPGGVLCGGSLGRCSGCLTA